MVSLLQIQPNIALAVSAVSRYAQTPRKQHIKAVKPILRYLSDTRDKGVIYCGRVKI